MKDIVIVTLRIQRRNLDCDKSTQVERQKLKKSIKEFH